MTYINVKGKDVSIMLAESIKDVTENTFVPEVIEKSKENYVDLVQLNLKDNSEKRKDSEGGSARIDTISLAIDNGTFQTCNHWYNSYNWMGRLASANGGKCSVIR